MMRPIPCMVVLATVIFPCGCERTDDGGTASSSSSTGVGGDGSESPSSSSAGGGGGGGAEPAASGAGGGASGGGGGGAEPATSGSGGGGGAEPATSGSGGGGGGAEPATSGSGGSGGETAMLEGVVQKGPFVIGSSVMISALDSRGNPTGESALAETTTLLGDYSAIIEQLGYVSLEATGSYFDELTSLPSPEPLTLRALYDVDRAGTHRVNVNLVTHLSHSRAQRLLSQGLPLGQAVAQAEGELRSALGIGGAGFDPGAPGHALAPLGEDTDGNAYLLAVSSVILQHAAFGTTPPGPLDAALALTINQIAADLADDGLLEAGLRAELKEVERILNGDLISDRTAHELSLIGASVTVPRFDRLLDTDGDGSPNGRDSCPLVANPDQLPVPDAVCAIERHYRWVVDPSDCHANFIAGDVTGEGLPDVITSSVFGNHRLYEGLGDGRLAAHVPFSTADGAFPSQLADLDGDGHLDGVVNAYRLSGWARGDGTGGFEAVQRFDPLCATCEATDTVLSDLNADGDLDVIRRVFSSTTARLLVSMGPFGDTPRDPAPIPNAGGFVIHYFGAADVNEDGFPDLMIVHRRDSGSLYPRALSVLPGNGDGTFAPARPRIVPGTEDIELLGTGDFDGDGHVDVMFNDDSSYGTTHVMFGDGAGGFSELTATSVRSAASTYAIADFTGDGRDDIVSDGAYVIVSRGRTFTPPQLLPLGQSAAERRWRIIAADFNGDGTQDLVSSLCQSVDVTHKSSLETILIRP